VTRLLLLGVLGVVTWLYFPDTRAMLLDLAEPIVTPVVRWNATEEMEQIGRNVVEHERLTGDVPSGAAWLEWLEYRYSSADMRRDPWGSTYQMEVTRDSIAIVSLGPDRTRQTDDDFHVATGRGT